MAKQISLMSHAPPIEESYLTHICLCNVCVSAPPLKKTGKKWQKMVIMAKVAKSGKSGKKGQLAKIGKNWEKVAKKPRSSWLYSLIFIY